MVMLDRCKEINTVFLTGAAGSAGRYLIEYLQKEQPQLTIVGAVRRKGTKAGLEKVKLFEVDLLDTSSIIYALKAVNPQVIFHFAANPDKGFEIPSAILHNNIIGTTNLFEAVRHTRTLPGPIIINVSSSEVYGDVDPKVDVPITEYCPMRPMSPYAVSKVAQDHLANIYHKAYGLRTITTRSFSYINNKRKDLFTSAFARQIALIERGRQQRLLHGNLDSVRALLDTRDIMTGYWLAATRARFGEAYNLGGSCVMSVKEVLEHLKGLATCPIPCEVDPSLLRPTDVTLQIPSSAKFYKDTGWLPKFEAATALSELLDYWRKEVSNHDG